MPRALLVFGLAAPLVMMLLVAVPAFAAKSAWSGTGPFPPGNGSNRVNALLLDSATGVLYAGTGSGTVFSYPISSLGQPPVAMNDSVEIAENMAVTIAILGNDFDPEGALDADSVEIRSGPTHGTASVQANGSAIYIPATGFVGNDSFTYTVRDAAGLASSPASVSIDVQAPPDDGGGGAFGFLAGLMLLGIVIRRRMLKS